MKETAKPKFTDKLLKAFYAKNPEFDTLQFRFHNAKHVLELKKKLKKAKMKADTIDSTLRRVKTHQRLYKLHSKHEVAEKLASRNFISANHIAQVPRNIFVKEHASGLGLSRKEAENLHKKATGVRNNSWHLWAIANGTVASAAHNSLPVNTLTAGVTGTFMNLPGYSDLFGSANYCECEECMSIFGPAAYLVDLLRIIDEYITKPNTTTIPTPFLFENRRPDIGEIPLDCANTDTLVPSIQVVNNVILNFLKVLLAQPDTDAVLEQMATGSDNYPFQFPFNAPLKQINVLLNNAGSDLGAIFLAWKKDEAFAAATTLGISLEQFGIVKQGTVSTADLQKFYNVQNLADLANKDVFLDKVQLDFAGLLLLLNQDLSDTDQAAGTQKVFFINKGQTGGKYVQANGGQIDNLIDDALIQINRITRLSLLTGYSIIDCDWAMRCIAGANAPDISDSSITTFQQLLTLQAKLGLGLQTACALLGPIKTYGLGPTGNVSAFDQLFNSPQIVSLYGAYHPAGDLNPTYQDTALPWTANSTIASEVNNINRILPGLAISLADVNALGAILFGNAPQVLDTNCISTLYRHVLLRKAVQVPMQTYLVMLKLLEFKAVKNPTIQEVNNLLELSNAIKQSGITPYQLDYIVNNTLSVYVNPKYNPDTITAWLAGVNSNMPQPFDATNPQAADSYLYSSIATLFDADIDLVTAAMQLCVVQGYTTSWEATFLTDATYAKSVLQLFSRWLMLAQALKLQPALIASIYAQPDVYRLDKIAGTSIFNPPYMVTVQSIYQVNQLMVTSGDFQQNLLVFIGMLTNPWSAPSVDAIKKLAQATGWDETAITGLIPMFTVTALNQVTDMLNGLQACFNIMATLGADTAYINTLLPFSNTVAPLPTWDDYKNTAANVLAKVSGQYGSDWGTVSQAVMGQQSQYERNVLLSFLLPKLSAIDSSINTVRAAYEFLLTNVEIGTAAQTSVIVEATSAAQLYLQRCRLLLEEGVTDLSHIEPHWWEWMLNYRVWQANREIFVYPENYLYPDLRQHTTPEFKQLTQTLQQSNISQSNPETGFFSALNNSGQNAAANSAYNSYMNSFAEVSKITVVESYYAVVLTKPTIFLLGRSDISPYKFYYCFQHEGMPWAPWALIDITINAPTGTMVYAFNRPFIFWAETHKNNSSSVTASGTNPVQTNYVKSGTASVMYSFLNVDGKWVQPQTLVNEVTICYDSDELKQQPGATGLLSQDPLFNGLLTLDDIAWARVQALRVTLSNYVSQPANAQQAERLIIAWSPSLRATGTSSILASQNYTPPIPPIDPVSAGFWDNLQRQEEANYAFIEGQLSGYSRLQPSAVLNLSLKGDTLINNSENLIFDSYYTVSSSQAAQPIGIQAALNIIDGDVNLMIVNSAKSVTDNGSLIDAKSSDISTAGFPLVDASGICRYFVGEGITLGQSNDIYAALKEYNVVDANGRVIESALKGLDLHDVFLAATKAVFSFNTFGPAQFQAIMSVLYNSLPAGNLFKFPPSYFSKVIPVKGLPGSFLVYLDNETFLLQPRLNPAKVQPYSDFGAGLQVSEPIISPLFAYGYLTKVGAPAAIGLSKSAYNALVTVSVIQAGHFAAGKTYNDVKNALAGVVGISTDWYEPIYSCLVNGPILFNDSFVSETITAETSANILAILVKNDLVDEISRINMNLPFTFSLLQKWLINSTAPAVTLSKNDMAYVYNVILQAPVPIVINYLNKNAASTTISGLVYDVIRLSTNAIDNLIQSLFASGVPGLLSLQNQQIPVKPVQPFSRFGPQAQVVAPDAIDATQVDFEGLYGQYFREIFYHIPMLVAYTLTTQQQFEVAQLWLQYIFNPTITGQANVTADVIVKETNNAVSPTDADDIITDLSDITKNWVEILQILDSSNKVVTGYNVQTDLNYFQPLLSVTQLQQLQAMLINFQSQQQAVTATDIQNQLDTDSTTAGIIFVSLQQDKSAVLTTQGFVNPVFNPQVKLTFLNPPPDEIVQMVVNILLNHQISSPAGNFWQYKPFRNHTIESLLNIFDNSAAINNYQNDPFDPFAIADMRIGAYEKTTFMQYIDNLVSWGDQYFRQYTRESITAAYMIYVYANDLLGPKPQMVGDCPKHATLTYNQIKTAYSNDVPVFLIELEHLPAMPGVQVNMMDYAFNNLPVYFGVPENKILMAKWDTVQDRITKINLSQNINGVFQQLPLFQPPINPLDLVKAGGAINNVLNNNSLNKNVPYYRYRSSYTTAATLCDVLIDLGNSLLAAFEKGDAEGLAMLQNTQEGQIQQMMVQIKEARISEIQATIASLNANQQSANNQVTYYTGLINEGLSVYEITNIAASTEALAFNVLAGVMQTASSIGYAIPQVGSPFAMTYGGQQIGSMVNAAAGVFSISAELSNFIAQQALTMGGYERRNQEWAFQKDTSEQQVVSITQQIEATNFQLQAAQQDLAIQQKSIAQNTEVGNYLKSKFTNHALYQWLTGQLCATYFQAFGLAMQAAQQAQSAYWFELDSEQSFINYNYWNNLYKGLSAGQALRLSLNRLDAAYRSGDSRRLEIEKTISLGMIDPAALYKLKTTGECDFCLNEVIFDYDYPGHYARKIKNISISIPVVLGPYQNIKATLTQLWNAVVIGGQNINAAVDALLDHPNQEPPHTIDGLRVSWAFNNQAIAISKGIDDSGLFVLNFEDERYLPFENTGAVSMWHLSLPLTTNYFDFEQLSDVVISVKYTALAGNSSLQSYIQSKLKAIALPGGNYVDCNMQSAAWQTFLLNKPATGPQTLKLNVPPVKIQAFTKVQYTSVMVQLVLGENVLLSKTSQNKFLSLLVSPNSQVTFKLDQNGTSTPITIAWDGKTMSPQWNFEFDLSNTDITPLLTGGYVSGDKLLNIQVIVLYDANVWS